MQRVFPLIWLLVLGVGGAHFASMVAAGMPCCRSDASQSDNCCTDTDASQHRSEAAGPAHASCCTAPETASPASVPDSPGDKPHDHDPERHPCKCPAQCCVVSKAPVTLTQLPTFDASTGHAPLHAPEWREPLPDPTLDRLKRPPRTRATA